MGFTALQSNQCACLCNGRLGVLPRAFPVLSFCQVWGLPAVLYLCYTDVMKLDLITVEAFKPLLSSRSFKGLVKVRFPV